MTQSGDPDRHLALKVLMMPRDTNSHGTIFGGVILSYIDQAGAVGAIHEIRRRGSTAKPLVTVGMNAVEFHHPVFVGDLLSCWTNVSRIGKTSITVHVVVESTRGGDSQKVTEADVTYVAIDSHIDDRRPVRVLDHGSRDSD